MGSPSSEIDPAFGRDPLESRYGDLLVLINERGGRFASKLLDVGDRTLDNSVVRHLEEPEVVAGVDQGIELRVRQDGPIGYDHRGGGLVCVADPDVRRVTMKPTTIASARRSAPTPHSVRLVRVST